MHMQNSKSHNQNDTSAPKVWLPKRVVVLRCAISNANLGLLRSNTLPGLVRARACKRASLGFGDINGPKPYKFIGFGDINGPKPYKFIRFGDINGPKPYKSIGFGDMPLKNRSPEGSGHRCARIAMACNKRTAEYGLA